jgi:hypothetical protein
VPTQAASNWHPSICSKPVKELHAHQKFWKIISISQTPFMTLKLSKKFTAPNLQNSIWLANKTMCTRYSPTLRQAAGVTGPAQALCTKIPPLLARSHCRTIVHQCVNKAAMIYNQHWSTKRVSRLAKMAGMKSKACQRADNPSMCWKTNHIPEEKKKAICFNYHAHYCPPDEHQNKTSAKQNGSLYETSQSSEWLDTHTHTHTFWWVKQYRLC